MDLEELRNQADYRDEFMRIRYVSTIGNLGRVLGDTDVEMEVDWGDGSPIETFSYNSFTGSHAFADGYGVYEVGFRLIAAAADDFVELQVLNANSYTAISPPPPTMRIGKVSNRNIYNASTLLTAIDDGFGAYTGQVGTGGTNTHLVSFKDDRALTRFPNIDVSECISYSQTWSGCSGLISFPLIDFSNAITFYRNWFECTGLERY